MSKDGILDDPERHHFVPRCRLQFREVRHRELVPVDRRLIALVEEGRHRNVAELREGIVDYRLMADFPQAAARSDSQHNASQHGCNEAPRSVPIFCHEKMGTDPYDLLQE